MAQKTSRSRIGLVITLLVVATAAGSGWWWWTSNQSAGTRAEAAVLYTCPMHPEIVMDDPGKCPICQMDLVPLESGDQDHTGMDADTLVAGLAPVTLPLERVQQFGVVIESVEERITSADVRTVGQVVPDETKLFRVRTKVSGWVERLYINETGQAVQAGDRMLDLYSPEVVSAQEEYLLALELATRTAASPYADIRQRSESLVRAARRRLDWWDIPESEVRRLEATRAVRRTVPLLMPYSGHVHELMVSEGDRIEPNVTLYEIADFRIMWVHAEVYEYELNRVREGQGARVSVRALPGREYRGRVDFIWPRVNPETRTTAVRLVVDNPDLFLKAGMYADVVIEGRPEHVLAVPLDAVISTGTRQLVFVHEGEGRFVPREIRVGRTLDGHYEVLEGLSAGDEVVTQGNYMIDSESRIRASHLRARTMTRGGEDDTGPPATEGHQH